jgi:hypothetical protein
MNQEQKKILLEKSEFKCKKCGFYSPIGNGLEINPTHNQVLCSVCNVFAPDSYEKFQNYLNDKIEWQVLETFRNSGMNRASHSPHKLGMVAKSKQGMLVARPPFGYNVKNGELRIDEETSETVRNIFNEFAEGKSLNAISKTYGLSVNGIKKILRNFSYLGKTKFDNQISQGIHQPIISSELFNRVQQKFEKNQKQFKEEGSN